MALPLQWPVLAQVLSLFACVYETLCKADVEAGDALSVTTGWRLLPLRLDFDGRRCFD